MSRNEPNLSGIRATGLTSTAIANKARTKGSSRLPSLTGDSQAGKWLVQVSDEQDSFYSRPSALVAALRKRHFLDASAFIPAKILPSLPAVVRKDFATEAKHGDDRTAVRTTPGLLRRKIVASLRWRTIRKWL